MTTMVGEILFSVTNIQLTATDPSRPLHRLAIQLLEEAAVCGFHLTASGQVIREYLVALKRPVEANGLGLSVAAAVTNLSEFLRGVSLFDETESGTLRLRQLLATHAV